MANLSFRYFVWMGLFMVNTMGVGQEKLFGLNKKVQAEMYLGHLTFANELNDEMLSIAQKQRDSDYIDKYYINKIYLDSYAMKFDSLFSYRQHLIDSELSPSNRMYYNFSLFSAYEFSNQLSISRAYLAEGLKSFDELKDPEDKAVWYAHKIYLFEDDPESLADRDSFYHYMSEWEKIKPQTSIQQQHRYLMLKSVASFLTLDEKHESLKELAEFTYKYKEDFYYAHYYLLKFLLNKPISEDYLKSNFYYLDLSNYYLNKTEFRNYDEYMTGTFMAYYKNANQFDKIIDLKEKIYQEKIATGKNDLAIWVANAYKDLGNMDSAYSNSLQAYHYYKDESREQDAKMQNELYTVMNSRSKLLVEKNKAQKNELINTVVVSVIILVLISIIIVIQSWSNKKLNQLNKELSKSNEYMEDFVSLARHDLKSPISSIINITSLIDEDTTQDEVLEYNDMTRELAERSLNIVSSLVVHHNLKYDVPYNMGAINVKEFLQEKLNYFRKVKLNKPASFELCAEDALYIYGNRELLTRLIQNLVENALKFTVKDRPIVILFEAHSINENSFYIGVKDNGIGIPKDQLGKIFNKRYKVDATSSGSGLGLAFCQEITRYHKGTISVESIEGKFTEFKMTFPKYIDKENVVVTRESDMAQV